MRGSPLTLTAFRTRIAAGFITPVFIGGFHTRMLGREIVRSLLRVLMSIVKNAPRRTRSRDLRSRRAMEGFLESHSLSRWRFRSGSSQSS